MLMFCILTNSQHGHIPIHGPMWDLFYFYSKSESNQTLRIKSLLQISFAQRQNGTPEEPQHQGQGTLGTSIAGVWLALFCPKDATCGETALCPQFVVYTHLASWVVKKNQSG